MKTILFSNVPWKWSTFGFVWNSHNKSSFDPNEKKTTCHRIKFNIRRNTSTTNSSTGEYVLPSLSFDSIPAVPFTGIFSSYFPSTNYRHVILPSELARLVPKSHLMTETEWRNLGVQQSPGWIHYMLHAPEPQVLLFRRPLPQQQGNASTAITSDTQLSRTLNKYRLQKRCWTAVHGRWTGKLWKFHWKLHINK